MRLEKNMPLEWEPDGKKNITKRDNFNTSISIKRDKTGDQQLNHAHMHLKVFVETAVFNGEINMKLILLSIY